MQDSGVPPDIAAGRLDARVIAENFSDPWAPLTAAAAREAADRCLFCEDAPCIAACPTAIDVPLFLEQIIADEPGEAGRTILGQNILGGLCARVCPTDVLCEAACVYTKRDLPPVEIARLQGYACDAVHAEPTHPFPPAPATGKAVAVIGAGPAGLACAHRLARFGHRVVVFDAKPKAGGLMEYGIPAYKITSPVLKDELDWLLSIGGIELRTGQALGRDLTLEGLQATFDAVFLAMGQAGVNALRVEGETKHNVIDAVDFIADVRAADDLSEVPVGQDVVVLGGGRTALDAAVHAKLLGAANVTIVYSEADETLDVSGQERVHATSKGIRIITGADPARLLGDLHVAAVDFVRAADDPRGERFQLKADQVFKAIGQHLAEAPGGLRLSGGHIAVDALGRTSLAGVWAGGDCTTGARDLAVIAIAQGRDAAEDIHAALTA